LRRFFQRVFEKWPNREKRCRNQRCTGSGCGERRRRCLGRLGDRGACLTGGQTEHALQGEAEELGGAARVLPRGWLGFGVQWATNCPPHCSPWGWSELTAWSGFPVGQTETVGVVFPLGDVQTWATAFPWETVGSGSGQLADRVPRGSRNHRRLCGAKVSPAPFLYSLLGQFSNKHCGESCSTLENWGSAACRGAHV
jgi:hypothetical protein